MKKLLTLAILLMAVLTLVGCGNKSSSVQQGNTGGSKVQLNITTKKVLVAYFAREVNTQKNSTDAVSGASLPSGNTSEIAAQIHEKVGGDTYEIMTEEPYTPNYCNLIDQAKKEQNDNSRPKLAGKIINMDSYDVVFLGYPDWWGTMPMAVFSFLEQYDLSGKTIIHFCTHEGSGLGQSAADIKKLCPKSRVLDGLSVRAQDAKKSQDGVVKWLQSIGIKANN